MMKEEENTKARNLTDYISGTKEASEKVDATVNTFLKWAAPQ
ncbi:hypothetical protein [Emticicia fontis]